MLQYSTTHRNITTSVTGEVHQSHIETPGEIFNWLAILWERGFRHDNPQGNSDWNAQPYNHFQCNRNVCLL